MSMLMQLGTRAMFAAYAQLQTTGQNIANANTVGYSRQQVVLTTTPGQYTGSGYFGRGVTVQTVTRASNMFLTSQAEATKAVASADSVRLSMLQQLERVFGTGSAGLGNSATQLFNAFSDLAGSPGDLSARQAVLSRAEDFASLARSNSDQLEAMQLNVVGDVRNSIKDVNEMAQGVADLNAQIAAAQGSGHAPNDLIDARDRLISQISEKIEVQTIQSSDGSTSIFVAGGQSLVLGGSANKLVSLPDPFDPARVSVGISVSGSVTALPTRALGSGSIAGLMHFQDNDLVDARNRLGQMVAALGTAVNNQQSYGIDLSGAAGAPLFKLGAPVALPANTNTQPPGQVSLSITDATQLKASEYTLEDDPANPGQYRVTRLSDGQQFGGLADGATVDGFTITFGSPPPSAGDRFLLKPVSTAQMGMASALTNPRAIAAASPVTASVAVANTGSAAVSSLVVTAAPTAPYQDLTIAFTSGTGDYEVRDSGGAVLATGTWTAGAPIAYNGFELNLNGVPASGDSIAVVPTAFPNSSNGNALAFDGMSARALVDGQTVTDAYAETLSSVGVRVQGAAAAAQTSAAVAQRADEALTSETGVNLDEEAAKLIQYQQYYQAAAKMLQTAQSMMDTLLELGR